MQPQYGPMSNSRNGSGPTRRAGYHKASQGTGPNDEVLATAALHLGLRFVGSPRLILWL